VPLTFVVMIAGSLLTRARVPADVGRVLIRLHAPESMSGDLPSLGRSAR
jgi:cation/acetate symporter